MAILIWCASKLCNDPKFLDWANSIDSDDCSSSVSILFAIPSAAFVLNAVC